MRGDPGEVVHQYSNIGENVTVDALQDEAPGIRINKEGFVDVARAERGQVNRCACTGGKLIENLDGIDHLAGKIFYRDMGRMNGQGARPDDLLEDTNPVKDIR